MPITVNQLIEQLQAMNVGEHEVRVHAFGGMRSGKSISRVSVGFDWDSGAIILHPEVQLTIYVPEKRTSDNRR